MRPQRYSYFKGIFQAEKRGVNYGTNRIALTWNTIVNVFYVVLTSPGPKTAKNRFQRLGVKKTWRLFDEALATKNSVPRRSLPARPM